MITRKIEPHTGSTTARDKKTGRFDQSATLQVTDKSIKRANKEFIVATYNVRTPKVKVSHKIEQILTGCEMNNISIVAIQEHRLKTTSDINLDQYGTWTLAHENSSHECHGLAILYHQQTALLVTSITKKSERLIALHLNGNPKM